MFTHAEGACGWLLHEIILLKIDLLLRIGKRN